MAWDQEIFSPKGHQWMVEMYDGNHLDRAHQEISTFDLPAYLFKGTQMFIACFLVHLFAISFSKQLVKFHFPTISPNPSHVVTKSLHVMNLCEATHQRWTRLHHLTLRQLRFGEEIETYPL